MKEHDWTNIDKFELNINVAPKINLYIRFVKRSTDFIIAFIVAVCLIPFWLIIILIMKCTMPGPVLFMQERVGYIGRTFKIYKFRTMRVDEEAIKTADSSKDEKRVTRFGNLLRRLKLDETPQIFNVLKGEMAIVGPRPTTKRAIMEYDMEARRLSVKPGLTGLAQIKGGIALDWPEKVVYDLQYIDSLSFINDIKIVLKTFWVILAGEEYFVKFR